MISYQLQSLPQLREREKTVLQDGSKAHIERDLSTLFRPWRILSRCMGSPCLASCRYLRWLCYKWITEIAELTNWPTWSTLAGQSLLSGHRWSARQLAVPWKILGHCSTSCCYSYVCCTTESLISGFRSSETEFLGFFFINYKMCTSTGRHFDMPNWFLCNYDGGIGDETLPNFIKRKHPRKGEKKKQGARTKFHSNKQPKRHRWFCGHLLVSFLTNLGLSK